MVQLVWKNTSSGSCRSASSGDYRIHLSGEGLITTYKINPFEKLGLHANVKEAQRHCQIHHDLEKK